MPTSVAVHTPSPASMPAGYPAEQVLAAYLALASVSAALIRPPHWHVLAGGLIAASCGLALIARIPSPSGDWAAGLRAVVPLLLYPLLYPLTGVISRGLPVWILDGPLERLEEAVFGGRPSMHLAAVAPWKVLSEFLHACYFSYYFLVPALPAALALHGRSAIAARSVGALTGCFCFCLLWYIWLPVTSPLYAYPPLGPPLCEGFFYRLAHAVSSRGGVRGGAFPSSHAALSVFNLILSFRLSRGVFWATLLPTAGLLVATVYGRYHFALDTAVGALVGAAFAQWAGAHLHPRRRGKKREGRHEVV